MASTAIDQKIGWGPQSRQDQRRQAHQGDQERERQQKEERAREAAKRAEAIQALVQSDQWWAVEEVFNLQFQGLLDALSGSDTGLSSENVHQLVGALRNTRALYESFDARLGAGKKALEFLLGARLVNLSAASKPQVAVSPF